MVIKSNIWKLFYVIIFSGVLFFTLLIFNTHKEISNRYHSQLRYSTIIVSNYVASSLEEDEMLLRFIAKEITTYGMNKNKKHIVSLIDNYLYHNKQIVGFVLVDTNAKYILSSSHVSEKLLNLVDASAPPHSPSRYNFNLALKSDRMILGKLYYSDILKEWIIPLQKSVKDKDGKVIAVMVAGLKLVDTKLSKLYASKNRYVAVLKDVNSFNQLCMQYYSKPDSNLKQIYTTPIYKKNIHLTEKVIKQKYGCTLDDLRKSTKTVTYEMENEAGREMFFGLRYNKDYNYWVLLEGEKIAFWRDFRVVIYRYLFIFITVFILLYILFKKIADADIKKRKELVYQAEHDILTNLPNRTYLYKNIGRWNKEHKDGYYVLFIDLDNFKNINDKFGHSIGDKILIQVAQRLKTYFSKNEMLIRQGGDEFIILFPLIALRDLEQFLKKIMKEATKEYLLDIQKFRIGFSVGICEYPKDATNIEDLLSLADIAMYEAKRRKNTYSYYNEQLNKELMFKADIEHELRGAIENNEIWMVYQPQVYAKDGSIYGVEALVRWKNEKLGFVPPDKFIEVAEQSGLILELGDYIFYKAISEINRLKKELQIDFRLSVNISVAQFMEKGFLPRLLKIIDKFDFNKSFLTLEITESMSIEATDEILPILNTIKSEGIELSMDDFGTGYSSLSILRELPIDELKIDKSFIDVVLSDEKEGALVSAIVNIGKNFDMVTLAEGVEDLDQLEKLRVFSCDIIQGYYFSKPLKIDELKEYLNS